MTRRAKVRRLGIARAAGLSVFLGLAWIWASPASAQLGGLIVTMTSPANGSTVGGTITVSASAIPVLGGALVQSVQFQLDGANLGALDTSAPYAVPWNTLTASNGSHSLRAVARNVLGLQFNSDPVVVTVSNDTAPPTVVITSPSSGATVTGTITVSANASDNVGVAGVQFRLDGAPLGAEDTTAPYSAPWNTTSAASGTHTLSAVARDAAGNNATSALVSVTVPDTAPPTVVITSPSSGATVTGTIAVSANASDNVGVAGVQFRVDGVPLGAEDTTAPYSVPWNTTTAGNGNHSLSAVARDAGGNIATSASVVVAVSNVAPDTTPPTVSITFPGSGATVSGNITVTASASDNVGVAGVQFRLDGAPLGPEDTTTPYSVQWDTASASNGSHSLTAVARDAAANTGTSSSVPVTVANGGMASGDVFVGLMDGSVQWRSPDGTLIQTLTGVTDGESSGLAFDAAGILYVPHWFSQTNPASGNLVTRFNANGNLLGTFGSGYNCNPSSFAFDAAGNVYVGQAECTGDILKLSAAGNVLASFDALPGVRGADHIALASDGCTMLYSNWTKNILRFNVCTNTQMTNFNVVPLPGETVWHLEILPDGGVLAADSGGIVRLDAQGNQVQLYLVPGNSWFTGIDSVGDGTFWANNAATSDIYHIDIPSGDVLAVFNTGTPPYTAIGVAVKP